MKRKSNGIQICPQPKFSKSEKAESSYSKTSERLNTNRQLNLLGSNVME